MTLRLDKMNELLLQQLSVYISREIEFPQGCLTTITKVETTPDIKRARVFISVIPDKYRGTVLEILRNNSRRLHEQLKCDLDTKFVPNLRFLIDEQEIFARKVDEILDEINKG